MADGRAGSRRRDRKRHADGSSPQISSEGSIRSAIAPAPGGAAVRAAAPLALFLMRRTIVWRCGREVRPGPRTSADLPAVAEHARACPRHDTARSREEP